MKIRPFLRKPEIQDLSEILESWRLLLAGFMLGILLAAVIYWIIPPPYRARATVVVNHNLEEVFPPEADDRELFYYLERETMRLEELAWSDIVLQSVVDQNSGITIADLRGSILELSQPSDGGWHLYATAKDPELAKAIASSWASSFHQAVSDGIITEQKLASAKQSLSGLLEECPSTCQDQIVEDQRSITELGSKSVGISPYLQVSLSQTANLPVDRIIPIASTLFAGGFSAMFLTVVISLFIRFEKRDKK